MAERFGWSVAALTVGAVGVGAVAGPKDGAQPTAGLAWLLFVGSSGHIAATLALFSFPEVRAHARHRPGRYLAAPAGLLLGAIATWLLLPARMKPPVLIAFFCWQLWHYQKQNLGIAALAASAARVPSISGMERRCILGAGAAGILALLAEPCVLQLVAWRPSVLLARMAFTTAVGLLVICTATGLASIAVRRRCNTATPSSVAAYLMAIGFPLPLLVAHSPYAAIGGLTLAHGLQYLLLVAAVAKGPARGGAHGADRVRTARLVLVVVATAGALAAVSHLHQARSAAGEFGFGAYLAVVMTHFLVDAGLWRLRDDFPRRWLASRIPQLLAPV